MLILYITIYLIVQSMIMCGINQERFSDTIIPLGCYFCISYWKVLINGQINNLIFGFIHIKEIFTTF
ncbi:hypothetical protein T07_9370 [Trichinella nelsoni]|uniref:Uncharacterized protein n=1 Tax=Trichinella nelsoni TaxID=6336 RepID=A0A0V0RVM7_9BILA|nr:hypothetical protein T07_9370 [Trichinella nelsoni]